MHAQRHHRGAHRPSHLKAVKPTDPPHPGQRLEPEQNSGQKSGQKPGPTPSKTRTPHEDRLAKLASFTTNLRMVSLNLLLLVGACLAGAVLWKLVSARETVIEDLRARGVRQNRLLRRRIPVIRRGPSDRPRRARGRRDTRLRQRRNQARFRHAGFLRARHVHFREDDPAVRARGAAAAGFNHLGQRNRHPGPLRSASGPRGTRPGLSFQHARRRNRRSG